MSPRKVLVAVFVLGATALPALAQTEEIQNKVDARLANERARVADERVRADAENARRERYEEIEIMARLLDRGLIRDTHAGPLTDSVGSVAFSPDGKVLATNSNGGLTGSVRVWDAATGKEVAAHAVAVPHLSGAQGVYLKGQGVVYSLTIPLHFQRPVAEPDKPALKEVTEWERVRKELRGEKVETAKPREAGGTSLADAVLKVLADNGKNLTRLPDGESVTVAITLPAPQSCVQCHSGSGNPMMRGGMPGGMGGGMGMMPPGSSGFPGGGGGPSAAARSPEPPTDTSRAEFRKYALLGDLAMKQHDYSKAVESFLKATGTYRKPPSDSEAQLEIIEVGSKLARSFMAMGKKAEADRIVQAVAKMTDRLASGAVTTKPAEGKPQMALPAKLIIAVSKKDLDLVGSKRIDFTAFRKEASVEYLNFDKPAEKPKP